MSRFKDFFYTLAIAETGGFSAAAEKLGISQPTLSKYIKKLEADLGIPLFDRSTLPLRLTEAGELYIEVGRQMLYLEHRLEKRLTEIKESKETVIRIGISPSRSPYLLPRVIAAYKKENPNSRIVIEEKTTAELRDGLAAGTLDMIVSIADETTEIFSAEELFSEKMLLAVPASLDNGLSATEILQRLPLISVGKGQAVWQMMRKIAKEMDIREADIECQSIESAIALIEQSLGIMAVPSYIAEFDAEKRHHGLAFRELPAPWADTYSRKICLFYRKDQILTKAEKSFIACLKKIGSQKDS